MLINTPCRCTCQVYYASTCVQSDAIVNKAALVLGHCRFWLALCTEHCLYLLASRWLSHQCYWCGIVAIVSHTCQMYRYARQAYPWQMYTCQPYIDMPTVHMSKHAYAKHTHVTDTHVTHTHVTHSHVKQAHVKHTFPLNVHTSFSYYLVCCTGKHWPQITAGDSCASCLPCRHGIDPCSTASRQPTRCRPRRPSSKTSSRMLKWSCGSTAQRSLQSGR